jgi:hypothetical protein
LPGDGGDGDIIDVDLVLFDQMQKEIERPLKGFSPDRIDGLIAVRKK